MRYKQQLKAANYLVKAGKWNMKVKDNGIREFSADTWLWSSGGIFKSHTVVMIFDLVNEEVTDYKQWEYMVY